MKKNGKRYTAPIKANWFKPKRHEVNTQKITLKYVATNNSLTTLFILRES